MEMKVKYAELQKENENKAKSIKNSYDSKSFCLTF